MAKRTRKTEVAPVVQEPITVSAKTQRLIDDIRIEFREFAGSLKLVNESRADFAPRFMKACDAWTEETGKGFLAFCRVLEPSIPMDRDGYRNHPAYQAATYLRRLQSPTAERGSKKIPESERPQTPLRALAVLIQTVLPVLDPHGVLFSAFIKEMNWSDEQAEKLQTLGIKLGPLHLKGKQNTVLHIERRKSEAA